MTITVGRLLLYVSALVVALVLLVVGWSWFGLGGAPSFADKAKAICRQELPAIANAPDFQTALTHSREMRLRLSTLTPAAAQQQLFSDWMAKLQASEDAGVGGDWAAAQADDAGAQFDVRNLGLSDGCLYHLH